MDAPALVDKLADRPVLVFGSLPPTARDLDLLLADRDLDQLRRRLLEDGFSEIADGELVRFRGCSVEAIDLVPASDWRLEEAELERLFAQALPLERYTHLVRPAPAHAVLILARRCARDGRLADKHRMRVLAALEEDPAAWKGARDAARGWRAETAVRELEAALAGRRPASWRARRARILARRRPGLLVTLSGLDGSGKSTQAQALRDTLERLGHPAVVVWTSVTAHGALPALAGAVRRLLKLLGRGESTGTSGAGEDPGRQLRQRSRLASWAWITFVALANGWWQSRATRRHLIRGRVVICDRWLLDSYVHMRYAYGEQHSYRWPLALIKALSPQPARAYLLDVSPEVAYARNQEYSPPHVARRARYYRDGFARFSVRRLDGERPVEELCQLIARDVVQALKRR